MKSYTLYTIDDSLCNISTISIDYKEINHYFMDIINKNERIQVVRENNNRKKPHLDIFQRSYFADDSL
jgi:hypothetical protein